MMFNKRSHIARLSLLVVALSGLLLAAPALAGPAQVASAAGSVEIGAGNPPEWRHAREGDLLSAGDVVRTGRDGRAELRWGGATIRLYGDSLLRLPTQSGVELREGTGLFDVLRRHGEDRFEVRTPEVVVSVKGTRFAVELGAVPAVAVYRGSVSVRDLALTVDEVLVREGFRAVGGMERPAELFLLDGPDPWDAFGPGARPPRVAAAADAPPPAARAVVDAKDAARGVYQREVVLQAARRNPEVARRLARVRSANAPSGESVAGSVPADMSPELAPVERAAVDPVLDSRFAGVEQALEEEFVEAWINGEVPGGGAPAGGTSFEINLISGSGQSGPDLVRVDEVGQISFWEFDKGQLDAIVDGQSNFPTSLGTLLLASNVANEAQFAQMLLTLLDK